MNWRRTSVLPQLPGRRLAEKTLRLTPHVPVRTGHTTLTIMLESLVVALVIWIGFVGMRQFVDPDHLGNSPESTRVQRPIMRIVVTDNGEQIWSQLGMAEVVSVNLSTLQLKTEYRCKSDAIGNWGVSRDGRTVLLSNGDKELQAIRDEVLLVSENLPDCARLLTELSSDGTVVVRIADGTLVRCWNFVSEENNLIDFTLEEPAGRTAIDSAGRLLAVSSEKLGLRLYDLTRGVPSCSFPEDPRSVKLMRFSEDGSQLAVIRGMSLIVFDTVTGDKRFQTDMEGSIPLASISFSPDGNWLAASGQGTGVQVINTSNGQIETQFPYCSSLQRVAFSESNDLLYSGCTEGIIRVFSRESGDEIQQIDLLELFETSRRKTH